MLREAGRPDAADRTEERIRPEALDRGVHLLPRSARAAQLGRAATHDHVLVAAAGDPAVVPDHRCSRDRARLELTAGTTRSAHEDRLPAAVRQGRDQVHLCVLGPRAAERSDEQPVGALDHPLVVEHLHHDRYALARDRARRADELVVGDLVRVESVGAEEDAARQRNDIANPSGRLLDLRPDAARIENEILPGIGDPVRSEREPAALDERLAARDADDVDLLPRADRIDDLLE